MKDSVKHKLDKANFPQNYVMTVMYNNLRKNVIEIVEMVY